MSLRTIARRLSTATLLGALATAVCGCATISRDAEQVAVVELARSEVCNSSSSETAVSLLETSDALLTWQRERGVELLPAGDPAPGGPFAIVELGARNEGGYGLLISHTAYLYRGLLSLNMSLLGEGAAVRPQQLTSPCVLMQLPAGTYEAVEVLDASYQRRAISTKPPKPAPSPVANPAQ